MKAVAWWAAPIALLVIHWLFYPNNNAWGVFFFQTAIATSCVLALHFYRQAKATLHDKNAPFLDFPWEFWEKKKSEREEKKITTWQQFRAFTWKEKWTYSRPALEVALCMVLLIAAAWVEKCWW